MERKASTASLLVQNVQAAKVDAIVEKHVVATETEASRVLLVDLPFLTETIGSKTAKRHTRIAALVKISSSLAALAHAGDSLVSSRFDTTAVSTIVLFCREEESKPDVNVIGNAFSLLSNLMYLGDFELVVQSGAPSLFVELVCSDAVPRDVHAYAAAALGNLTADPYGASCFTREEQERVIVALEVLLERRDTNVQLRTNATRAIKNLQLRQSNGGCS